MNIEEIMKPYFDKKEEIENKSKINDQYLQEKRILELRLDRLRKNKEQEIEEYVKNAVSDRPDFYAGYGAMVRKDLEQAYIAKEQGLVEEIELLEAKIAANHNEIVKFNRVDVRELVDAKQEVRKTLMASRKELEIKLKEYQLEYDSVMLRLSRNQLQHDENHSILNGGEFKSLFEESHRLVDEIYSIQKDLKQIEENLVMTEITHEEAKVLMMSMTPWEKEEYDRRRTAIEISIVEEVVEAPVVEEAPTVEVIEETPVVEETSEEVVEEKPSTLEENYSEFLKDVFSDITDIIKSKDKVELISLEKGKYISAKNPETKEFEDVGEVDLEESDIELPNGLYLSKRNIFQALDDYRKQNKGRTFTVDGMSYEVNRKTVRKVKKSLRDCSIIKLLREKKLSLFDIKRVYGKDKADEYRESVEIGSVKTNAPSGEYINLSDFYLNLKKLFAEKSPTWFEKLTSKFTKYEDEVMDANYEQVEEEPELSWTPEEPEYEIVKGKVR